MRIGKVTGTVTATIKAQGLTGKPLMLVDITDAHGKVVEPAIVAIDTCGAGRGDRVLISSGSAARQTPDTSGLAIDAAIVAVLEHIDTEKQTPRSRGKR